MCLRIDSLPATFDTRVVFRGSTSVGIDGFSSLELLTRTPIHHLSLSERTTFGGGHLPPTGQVRSKVFENGECSNFRYQPGVGKCFHFGCVSLVLEQKLYRYKCNVKLSRFKFYPLNFAQCLKEIML